MAEQEHPMPKDFLVEMLEKEDEKFFMECYEVHKEYEIKARSSSGSSGIDDNPNLKFQ